jgi:hypothetical protein
MDNVADKSTDGKSIGGKWTRRGLITAGVVAGGALVVGVALRPGYRTGKLAPLTEADNEYLVNTWVMIDTLGDGAGCTNGAGADAGG